MVPWTRFGVRLRRERSERELSLGSGATRPQSDLSLLHRLSRRQDTIVHGLESSVGCGPKQKTATATHSRMMRQIRIAKMPYANLTGLKDDGPRIVRTLRRHRRARSTEFYHSWDFEPPLRLIREKPKRSDTGETTTVILGQYRRKSIVHQESDNQGLSDLTEHARKLSESLQPRQSLQYSEALPDGTCWVVDTDLLEPNKLERFLIISTSSLKTDSTPKLAAASLTRILTRLASDQSPIPEEINAFLYTFHKFMTSYQFLDFLISRYSMIPSSDSSPEQIQYVEMWRHCIQLRVLNVVNQWIKQHFYDFEHDSQLRNELEAFLMAAAEDKESEVWSRMVRDAADAHLAKALDKQRGAKQKRAAVILSQMRDPRSSITWRSVRRKLFTRACLGFSGQDAINWYLETQEPTTRGEVVAFFQRTLDLRLIKCASSGRKFRDSPDRLYTIPRQNHSFEKFHPTDVAQQLSLVLFSLFSVINPLEVLVHTWPTDELTEYYNEAVLESNNLSEFLHFSNFITEWVISEIVQTVHMGKRAAITRRFISIAKYCQRIGNHQGAAAVVAGLQSPLVLRLSKTWRLISKRTVSVFRELVTLYDPADEFATYRLFVGSTPSPSYIPLLVMSLQDLALVQKQEPDYVAEGLVNVRKNVALSQLIAHFHRAQERPFDFRPHVQIQGWLRTGLDVLAVETMREHSFSVEPSGGIV